MLEVITLPSSFIFEEFADRVMEREWQSTKRKLETIHRSVLADRGLFDGMCLCIYIADGKKEEPASAPDMLLFIHSGLRLVSLHDYVMWNDYA